MRYSALTHRLAAGGSSSWEIHFSALERQARGEDILALTVGDSDFPSPTAAVDTAVSALKGGMTHYTRITGLPELRQAVAMAHEIRTGHATAEAAVTITAGAQNALFNTLLCLAGESDEVIVPEPFYATYPGAVRASGATFTTIPSPPEKGFHPDLDALEQAITPQTRVLLFASPSNPTGAMLSHEEWERIAALAEAHDLWVISDEVYAGLAYDRPHVSAHGIPALQNRAVVLGSLSKSHAMAGWRIGWIIAPQNSDLCQHLARLVMANTTGFPGFLQAGAVQALKDEPRALPELVAAYQQRRDQVAETLASLNRISCASPEGGMFLLLDVRETGLSAQDFAAQLLEETGLALLPADDFGPSAKGHLRLNIGVPDRTLTDALKRLTRFMITRL